MNEKEYMVIKAYLQESWSHRKIQKDVLRLDAPVRGGGFEAMTILHKFGLKKEHKGKPKGQDLTKSELVNLLNNWSQANSFNEEVIEYLPLKSDIEIAIGSAKNSGKQANLENILEIVEHACVKEGKMLKANWKMITERNIEIWFSN